jgi:hypothetical protein
MNDMAQTDIYRVFHPTRKDYTFFSAACGTFSKIDYNLGHKEKLDKHIKNINNSLCPNRP